ncbi:MAG: DUF3127 domain-containing protein [Saprospiraceae bacterium]|nr:DUF3127 domain-containing protein [Saprospiraceae bacterium]
MSFEVAGKLIKKYDTENKTGSFQAREFVIEVDGQYPQFVKFQLVQDRCSLLDAYEEGETIKVHFDLRGREWQGKYFTNLNAWRLEKAEADTSGTSGATTTTPPPAAESFPSAADEPANAGDDLPF